MKSALGSLPWIARQVRLAYAYLISKLQSVVADAQVKHLEACNRLLKDMKASSDDGSVFKAGRSVFPIALVIT
eukprot:9706823-Karenia_brevis.AAC.1